MPAARKSGEIAFTVHGRQVDIIGLQAVTGSVASDGAERRAGIDGSWDLGIGLWFENSLSEIKINRTESLWQDHFSLGADYTLSSGVNVVLENFIYSTGAEAGSLCASYRISALSASYALSILDSANIMVFYDWGGGGIYPFLGFSRVYDNMKVNIFAYSSPAALSSSFSGQGLQLAVTYNH